MSGSKCPVPPIQVSPLPSESLKSQLSGASAEIYSVNEMPRGKSFRRSVAARRREEVKHLPPSPEFVEGRGTGTRSRPRQYPVSVSGKTHKLVDGVAACHTAPDAVCILAPSNNLTTSSTPAVAGEEFRKLLISARERWHNVFVLDFVPRLTVSPELQNHVSREFHSVAKSLAPRSCVRDLAESVGACRG
ncbi:hypothetical protein N1851_022524 [Merluccius polli]|uniref:Uncharacterized protein n=1 Tax=Merluccius polli TaxID=89951 RepID=A0AA47NVS9_MERPO|nr:hypothetical protein N1851_022524 [Merluccius polli]